MQPSVSIRPRGVTLTAALAAGLLAAAAGADTETWSFDVSPGDRLVLDTEWGEIDVTTGDGTTVELAVEHADQLEFDHTREDGTLTIRATRRDTGIGDWFRGWGSRPSFTLTVPREHDLSLRAAGGDIAVGDLDGELRARTSGGSLVAGYVTGSLQLETSGGSINVERAGGTVGVTTSGGAIRLGAVGGAVEARTSGGSIHVAEAAGPVSARTSGGSIVLGSAGAIDARTSGGSIRARIHAQPHDESSLRTSGGDITVALAEGVAVDIEAQAFGGRVLSDIPLAVQGEPEKSSLRGSVAGGGPVLSLRTSGGSIFVEPL